MPWPTAAAGYVQQRVERRRQLYEQAARQTDTDRAETRQRIEAERQAAYAVYRPALDDCWWSTARPEQIVDAVTAAAGWAEVDPRAADAYHHARSWAAGQGIDLDAALDTGGPGLDRLTGDVAAVHAHEPAEDRWKRDLSEVTGPALAAELADSPGWGRLQHRLDDLDRQGEDVTGRVRRALARRELDSAHDKAATLTYRLKDPAAGSTARAQPRPRTSALNVPTVRPTHSPSMEPKAAVRARRTQNGQDHSR